jgi:hypothetical protein
MKVLVATEQTQGQRSNDFCWVPEGEMVRFGMECDSDRGNPDGGCGCSRSMSGMKSHKATTTMMVVDKDITPEQYTNAVLESLKGGGWIEKDATESEWATEDAEELLRVADGFDVGDIIEKRGYDIQQRR